MPANNLDYSDLSALFINTTLTRSPADSHTQLLIDTSAAIMAKQGVHIDMFRSVDHPIASGVYPDMREHGWEITAARPRKSSSGCMPTPENSMTVASGSTMDGLAAA